VLVSLDVSGVHTVRLLIVVVWAVSTLAVPAYSQPTQPEQSLVDPAKCRWEWKKGGGIGVWAERCALDTGVWELQFQSDLPGFVLTVDGKTDQTVLQVFKKPADADISAILPILRERGYIPDDEFCVFKPASIRPVPRTVALFDIRPIGARKAALDATPSDEVPEPPCGDYGWSTHGERYFMTDIGHPEIVVYINTGQDGMMFDPTTVTIQE
jgi:hypothetical protein